MNVQNSSGKRWMPLAAGAALLGAALVAAARRKRTTGDQPYAYPPVDTLKPLADGLWIVDSGPISAMGLVMPVRMTVIRLDDGSLMLHSPTSCTAQLQAQLADLGPVRHLVAPSVGHWTFLAEWQSRYPDAATWAVEGLKDRAQVRRAQVRIDGELGQVPPPEWDDAFELATIAGGPFAEACLFHKPTRTLLLADLIDNMEPERLPPVTSLALRLARATSATTPLHVRGALLLQRGQNRQVMDRLTQLRPDRVIFAHGQWFEDDAAERLIRAWSWLD